MSQPSHQLSSDFFAKFQAEARALECNVKDVKNQQPKTSLAPVIAPLDQQLAQLINDYRNASHELPPHDQKICSEIITNISTSLNHLKQSTSSRPKFSFKKRNGPPAPASVPILPSAPVNTTVSSSSAIATPSETVTPYPPLDISNPNTIHRPIFPSGQLRICNHDSIFLALPASTATLNTSFTLLSLSNIIIDLNPATAPSPLAALTVRRITSSILILGRVDGAVHLTGLTDVVVIVAARQVRMHESHNVRLYMHCASEPIIEGCDGIGVAPLPAGLWADVIDDKVVDRWSEVKDFNVLGNDGGAGHWSVLGEAERTRRETWDDVLRCEDGSRREGLLLQLGVKTGGV